MIFDRGYPSYDMFNYLDDKGLFFLIRTSSSWKKFRNLDYNDNILDYEFENSSKKLRVLKIELPDGTIEVLVTNIFNKNIILICTFLFYIFAVSKRGRFFVRFYKFMTNF